MLKLSRNNQNIKMFGVPPNTLPLVIYIGIFCYWVLLHYNMSFKTIAGGFSGAFWTLWSTFWKLQQKKKNLPKLSCGFNHCLGFKCLHFHVIHPLNKWESQWKFKCDNKQHDCKIPQKLSFFCQVTNFSPVGLPLIWKRSQIAKLSWSARLQTCPSKSNDCQFILIIN